MQKVGTYRRLIGYVKPYRGKLAFAIICMVFYALFESSMVYFVAPTLRAIFYQSPPELPAVAGGFFESIKLFLNEKFNLFLLSGGSFVALRKLAVILVLIVLLKSIFFYLQAFFMSQVLQGMMNDFRNMLFRRYSQLPLFFFQKRRTGQLISRIVNDVQVLNETIAVSFSNMIRDPLIVLFYFALLLILNWRLTLILVIVAPPAVFIITAIGKHLRHYSTKTQKRVADFTSILQEAITGIRVVKGYSGEEYEVKKFEKSTSNYLRNMLRMIWVRKLVTPFNEVGAALLAAFILVYAGGQVIRGGGFAPDEFIQYIVALFLLSRPLKSLGESYGKIQQGLAAAKRVFEVIDEPVETFEETGNVDKSRFENEICYDNVSFRYSDDKPWALRNISICIKKGEVVALVGPSGAGKSTFVDLLLRFFDPTEGRITIDGVDIRNIKLSSLRSLFGIVTQETILFNDTIARNIAYADYNPDRERIVEAAHAANAYDFIMSTPNGFDTYIGDRGMKLSGGERQRLAIARAIYRNPQILIFDEATSSLDSESERLVQEAIDRLIKGRTAIVIAHRLATIVKSDRIIVMKDGHIVQEGKHNELIEQDGLYKILYTMQFNI